MNSGTTRRRFLQGGLAAGAGVWMASGRPARAAFPQPDDTFGLLKRGKKIPVIFDTDIGNDIDDTWALTLLLKSPEADVRLVVSDSGNDAYRARILAKMLQTCGRTDVPVGVGIRPEDKPGRQSAWVGDYQLADYPGTVHEDGVGAMIRAIHESDDPVTVVCVGPVPNLAEALRRDPTIARNARFVGMHGSVRRGYGGSARPSAEYNVRAAPAALQAVFAAPWSVSITPLDTCGIVNLSGERYQKVRSCTDPGVQALMENYRVWTLARNPESRAYETRSSTLFDTVAVYMSYTEKLLEMETLPIRVTDEGMTVVDPERGRPTRCAMNWRSLDGFRDHLVARLTGG